MKIQIIVHPNNKNPRIEMDMTETLHVYVEEPPLEGKANKAVIKSLAKHFKVRPNQIFINSGVKNKLKVIEII